MDCTYFQNKLLFSIFILSLSHDLVLGKPMNVVFVRILELLNPAISCLLQQLLVTYPRCSNTQYCWERTGATLRVQTAAWSVMDVMYFLPIC